MDWKEEQKLIPRAVQCMRGSFRHGDAVTYDSEIVINGQHYVVGTNFKTSDEAKSAALPFITFLIESYKKAGEDLIQQNKWPKAKE